MMHQCYYCDQIFDSKEKLFDHLDNHSDTNSKQELEMKKKRLDIKLKNTLKKDQTHIKKINDDG